MGVGWIFWRPGAAVYRYGAPPVWLSHRRHDRSMVIFHPKKGDFFGYERQLVRFRTGCREDNPGVAVGAGLIIR
jgi:hypothetical protein